MKSVQATGTSPEQAARRRRALSALVVAAVAVGVLAIFSVPSVDRSVSTTERSTPSAAEMPATAGNGVKWTLWSSPQAVPDLHFVDKNGKPFSLADFRGKAIVLNIWATWCPTCRDEMPTLDRLQVKLGGPALEVLTLSVDSGDAALQAERFFREVGVNRLPIYIDPTGNAASEVRSVGLPTTLLIDRDGKEVARLVGGADWDSPEVIALIERRIGPLAAR